MPAAALALVLGASGYVGGRLVPLLLETGYRVRCLARSPQRLRALGWGGGVEIVGGDLLDEATLPRAFEGAAVVYYLVHSMGAGAADFAARDRRAAANAAGAAAAAGARRLVYLGGLGDVDAHTSAHLRSRAEVAEVLHAAAVPVTVLRAAVIIGSGSASFEMLRYLVERLPVMVTPRWVDTRVQPVAIRDVLRCLVGVAAEPDDGRDHDYDIGGPDVLSYLDMMQSYARVAGLRRRLVLKVPLLSPALSSYWAGLVTPVPFRIARPLIDGLTSEVVVRRGAGAEDIRDVVGGPWLGYVDALRLALRRVRDAEVDTSWRDAEGGISPAEPYPGDPEWSGGTLLRSVTRHRVAAPAGAVYAAVCRVGGERGWPSYRWAWGLRGAIDRLAGGVGLRRGRRDPDRLRVGDALDFWRVEAARAPAGATAGLVRLRAEMRLPGRAWLEWRIEPAGDADEPETRLVQRALFAPRGVLGRLYWWVLLPLHGPIFSSMARALAADARALAGARPADARAPAVTSSGAPTAPRAAPGGRDGGTRRPPPRGRRAG